jgi:hypothetical protein
MLVFSFLLRRFSCVIAFLLLPICGFSQEEISEENDAELIKKYNKEIQKMEGQGASISDFYKVFVKRYNPLQYLISKQTYYRQKAFAIYSYEKRMEERMLNNEEIWGEQSEEEKEQEKSLSAFRKRLYSETYQDYIKRKQTKEAKAQWEDYINDSILKLVVTNIKSLNPKEKEQQEELTNLLNSRSFMKSVLVTDGKQTKQIKRDETGELQEEIIVID